MKTIQAKYVTYQYEGSIVSVGFADHEFDTQNYVLLQRETEPTSQDTQLGQDKIFIQIDSPLKSAYGGVLKIDLNAKAIRITIEKLASQRLGYSEVEIDCSESSLDMQDLKEHLVALVGSEAVLSEAV